MSVYQVTVPFPLVPPLMSVYFLGHLVSPRPTQIPRFSLGSPRSPKKVTENGSRPTHRVKPKKTPVPEAKGPPKSANLKLGKESPVKEEADKSRPHLLARRGTFAVPGSGRRATYCVTDPDMTDPYVAVPGGQINPQRPLAGELVY